MFRLEFAIRMTQMINIKISTKILHCKMNDDIIEKAYNFSLRLRVKKY